MNVLIKRLLFLMLAVSSLPVSVQAAPPTFSLDDFSRQCLRMEQVDGRRVAVVEAVPKSAGVKQALGYSRLRAWMDVEDHGIRKLDFWGLGGQLSARLSIREQRPAPGEGVVRYLEFTDFETGQTRVLTLEQAERGGFRPGALFEF